MPETKELKKGEVVIYKTDTGPELEIELKDDSIWLTQSQLATLFGTQRPAITKHLRNIFNTSELSEKSACSVLEHTASDGKTYKTRYYNLDAVIAVGYRVNSKRATQFRIWATKTLRDFLLKGLVVNQERLKEQSQAKLKELEGAVNLLQRVIATRRTVGVEKELLLVMTEYASTWTTLVRFDDNSFPPIVKSGHAQLPAYEELLEMVAQFSKRLSQNNLTETGFGEQRGTKFKQLLEYIEIQNYGVAEAGALLFYSIIKDQPFVAGNKQIAALLLLVYLVQNNSFYNRRGERKLDDATMVALSVLVEESSVSDKVVMTQLIASMVNQK
ncbi:MAG: virulence RhuM family protein [Candidatus Doudnabacteria bacterium]|nr:virulence RhuM family protein [Candidatus Doudnabacteria bacterium]